MISGGKKNNVACAIPTRAAGNHNRVADFRCDDALRGSVANAATSASVWLGSESQERDTHTSGPTQSRGDTLIDSQSQEDHNNNTY